MLLLEPVDSPYADLIQHAANANGLPVQRLDRLDPWPSDAALIGVGPSIRDPLDVARHLRSAGGRALVAFFTHTRSAGDDLEAAFARDPFLCPRHEVIVLPGNVRQLAARMRRVAEHLEWQQRAPATRPRSRRSRAAAVRRHVNAIDGPYLADIVAHASDAIFTTDSLLRIVTWNQAAERLFGLGADAAVGGTLDELDSPGAFRTQLAQVARRVLATGLSEQVRVPGATARGTTLEVAASVAPVRDTHGNILGLSVIARDDTEQQRLEEAVREARRQKDEFLAIMSHELRTPLTSILGYTDMLLRGLSGPLAPLASKYVGNVRSAGDRLLELANGLLVYTRLEAGAERLALVDLDLLALVQQHAQHFHSQATARQIHLQVAADLSSAPVHADGGKIGDVLRSFIGNALKFTPDGGSISVRVGRDPERREAVRVTVADSGVGLRDEQVQRVWERFYQADATLTRPYGGMGLGLSIARQLVALHGGAVGAQSRGPGHGSTFWFSLPLRRRR